MITIFNRRELTTVMSLDRQGKIRAALSAHNIDYTMKIHYNGFSGSRNAFLPHYRPEESCQFYFYVKREDYERARQLIG